MWDGFNKRKFPRLNLRCEILIQAGDKTTPYSAVTENVGAGGVCVILDQPLERFAHCRVKLELDDRAQKLECRGKVVWAIPTAESGNRKKSFDIGIEFTDLQPVDRQLMREFIESSVKKGFREIKI